MAFSSSSSSVLVIVLSVSLLLAAAVPSEATLTINGLPIGQVLVGATAICPNSALAAGETQKVIQSAPVELRCGSGSTETVVKSTVTDLTGLYKFAFNVADTLLFDPNTCYIKISIPATACSLPLPNAFLKVPFAVLTVVENLVLGNLAVLVPGAISCVV